MSESFISDYVIVTNDQPAVSALGPGNDLGSGTYYRSPVLWPY